jgi:cell division protein FtsQ
MGEGHQVVLGRSDDLDRKLATLRFLMMDGTPFNFLDLRPTTPYYR